MRRPLFLLVVYAFTILIESFGERLVECDGDEIVEYLEQLNANYSSKCHAKQKVKWDFITNVTENTRNNFVIAKNDFMVYQASVQLDIIERYSECETYPNDLAERELKFLMSHGPGNLTEDTIQQFTELLATMQSDYATIRVCEYLNPDNCQVYLEPDDAVLQYSENPEELEWYCTQWYNEINKVINISDFSEFVTLQNSIASSNGFNNMIELWLQAFHDGIDNWSSQQIKETLLTLWNELKPFYNKLHAFVRMQLRNLPENEGKIKRYGSLPLHLTRHIWSQNWVNLDYKTRPFRETNVDATEALRNQGFNLTRIYQVADEFIVSLGLEAMPSEFWVNSILEKPEDREMFCEANAEDMCSGLGNRDFRVKLCGNVTMKDFIKASKFTGIVEYFMKYSNLHYIFRSAANPAFFEGLSGTFALATGTPSNLECRLGLEMGFGICDEGSELPQEISINYLYRIALEKFPLLSSTYATELWKWEVYEEQIAPEQYNARWYQILQEQQGVVPPIQRISSKLFDPAAIYGLISEKDEFMSKFFGTVMQFQFYEAFCVIAGEYDPGNETSKALHECDFTGNTAIGDLLKESMSHGFNTSWPDILELITGSRSLSTNSIIKYFKPLFDFIETRLEEAGEIACYGKECQVRAREYVQQEYEAQASMYCNNASLASWNYETDLTNPEAEAENANASLRYSEFLNREWKERISQFDYELFDKSEEKRQLKFLNAVGVSALETSKLEQYNQVLSEMSKIYGTAKVCPYNNRDCNKETEGLSLEPGLENIMANSRHYNELAYIWRAWRDETGKQMRDYYNSYLNMSQEAAEANGFENMGDFWILRYESDTFKEDMATVWQTVKGIYEELHAYVRFRLSQSYPQLEDLFEPIPAHILGNMWSQTWGNIYNLVIPYPNAPIFDVTESMKELFGDNEAGIRMMFTVANGFFTQTQLADMAMSFGDKAMIQKPEGREVICHASAWDFCDGNDFRVKMCTNLDHEDFITVHHELGHIQYYLQYKSLNITFRTGANPGFHEAVGDVVSLSVNTPKHMKKIGLVDEADTSNESTINFLMKIALDKIAFLPFGFLIDSYRWKVFSGEIPRDELTYHWLKMRSDFQGIRPPFKRNEEDFDPGAKYHVPGDVPYIRYFVSYILQFQIHKTLCMTANEYIPNDPNKPLHNCDIFRNSAAGQQFKAILQAGGSRNWQDLLEEVTGERNLNAGPLIEYFEPLLNFFREQRSLHNYPISWNMTVFEEYYGDGPLPPTSEYPTSPVPTTTAIAPTGCTVSASTTDLNTDPTDRPSSTSVGPKTEDNQGTSAAVIVIGIILGIVVVVILVGYFITNKLRKRRGSSLIHKTDF